MPIRRAFAHYLSARKSKDLSAPPRRVAAVLALAGLVGGGLVAAPLLDAATAPPAAAVIDFDCGSPQGLGYFVNTGAGTVSIVYTGSASVIATVAVGGTPFGVGPTPDGKKIYVAGAAGGLAVIDADTLAVTPVPALAGFPWANPVGAWPSEDGSKMFVSDYDGNFVAVIDTATDTVVDAIPIPVGSTNPGWMDAVGNLLFVANSFGPPAGFGGGGYTIIDMDTDSIVQNVQTPEGAHTIAVNDDFIVTANSTIHNNLIYVHPRANPAAAAVQIAIPVPTEDIHGIAFVRGTDYLIVPTISRSAANAHTYVYDISTGALLRTFNSNQQKLNMPIVSPITPDVFIAGGDTANTAGSMDLLRVVGAPATWTYTPDQAALQANPDNHTPAFSCLRPLEGTKALADSTLRIGQTTRLTVTIQNTNTIPSGGVTGAAVVDSLPAAVQIATPANVSTTCAVGVASATPGTQDVSLAGATIPAATVAGGVKTAGTCTFGVDVIAVGPAGAYTNVIPAGGITGLEVGPSTDPVTAPFTVYADPTVAAQVDFPIGRANPTDQFTTTITTGPTTVATATTAGTEVGPQNQSPSEISSATATEGSTYTFTQTPSGGADPSDYTTTHECVDARHGNVVLASGSGPVASVAIPAQDADVAVVCTFTNVFFDPALTVVKAVTPAALPLAGGTVNYTFAVTNTGNVPLSAIAIAETSFSGTGAVPVATCPPGALAPGATVQCTASYTVTQADAGAGGVDNTAAASGLPPTGPRVTSAPSTVRVAAAPTAAASPLAYTGTAPDWWLLIGAALALLIGAALFVVARRRRSA